MAASKQNSAFGAILFLYRSVLEIPLERIDALRARRKARLPVVLSTGEVRELLAKLDEYPTKEPFGVITRLMYGRGCG